MLLLLFRHATAEDHGIKPDADRQLTDKGDAQVHRAAEYLSFHQLLPDIVLTSPVTRARQTAERLCTHLELDAPTHCSWLSLGTHSQDVLAELAAYREFDNVMIVGHEPDFSDIANTLIGSTALGVRVKKASLIGIQFNRPAEGTGELQFAVTNKLMRIT